MWGRWDLRVLLICLCVVVVCLQQWCNADTAIVHALFWGVVCALVVGMTLGRGTWVRWGCNVYVVCGVDVGALCCTGMSHVWGTRV